MFNRDTNQLQLMWKTQPLSNFLKKHKIYQFTRNGLMCNLVFHFTEIYTHVYVHQFIRAKEIHNLKK